MARMASLLELTQQGDVGQQQGDVGTVKDESKLSSSFKLMDPQQLYELWEKQNWVSADIDFTRDVEDWASLSEQERHDITWTLSSFFIGEERVTTQFSGLVMSYEDQHEEAFLTTQQVDEARHAQHFNRFYERVVGLDMSFDERLEKVREDVSESFIQLFDHNLVEAGQRLIENPADLEAKVDFVTMYHMVIEGTLALTGQYTVTEWCERNDKLPGFLEGFKKISQDEHRHVAYGTWFLQQKCRDNPDLQRRVQDKLSELLPIAAGVLAPPGKDPFGEWELMGFNNAEVNEFAFNALTRRLKVIGIQLPAVEAAA
jgi:ribonucleoside-diphosphate reductase beta chain